MLFEFNKTPVPPVILLSNLDVRIFDTIVNFMAVVDFCLAPRFPRHCYPDRSRHSSSIPSHLNGLGGRRVEHKYGTR